MLPTTRGCARSRARRRRTGATTRSSCGRGRRDGGCVLEDLGVEPGWMARGIGARLFRVAADRARELGAHTMEWGAEPNAVGFYEKVGGRHLRIQVSEWGRQGS